MRQLRSIYALRSSALKLGLILLLAVLTGCATSPTGRSQLTMFSESQMASMGQASFAQIKEQEKVYNHRPTQSYVQCISDALFAVIGTPSGEWEVVVFADDTPNAFALPGQKIGVYRGMLNIASSPDQLAAVIGHEIGHVQARHGNERASTNFATQMGLAIASVALATEGGTDERMLAALGLGAQVGVLLPFSRQHEIEADLIGLDLMARAGFDPRESVQLWENMRQKAGGNSVEFLSTHPGHGTRIRTLQQAMPDAMITYTNARQQGRAPRCSL